MGLGRGLNLNTPMHLPSWPPVRFTQNRRLIHSVISHVKEQLQSVDLNVIFRKFYGVNPPRPHTGGGLSVPPRNGYRISTLMGQWKRQGCLLRGGGGDQRKNCWSFAQICRVFDMTDADSCRLRPPYTTNDVYLRSLSLSKIW